MKKILLLAGILFLLLCDMQAQQYYFPPNNSTEWDTLSLAELNWCEDELDDLYTFLEENNTKAFLLLKNGKMVVERYFDNFNAEQEWYWASVSKSLTAFLIGVAQDENYLSVDSTSSNYLGASWSNCNREEELKITVAHHLSMSTGLNEQINNFCTNKNCLQCLAEPNTRWAYYNGAYALLNTILEKSTSSTLGEYFREKIASPIGMDGNYRSNSYSYTYYSNARSMARFGLLMLNKGSWKDTVLLKNQNYFSRMVNTSQGVNPSYGFGWWLNGKENYKLPFTQELFRGELVPSAPAETIAGIGSGQQLLNIVPSQGIVMLRIGDPPKANLNHPLIFNGLIWDKLNKVICTTTNTDQIEHGIKNKVKIYPNPTQHQIQINSPLTIQTIRIVNTAGKVIKAYDQVVDSNLTLDVSEFERGVYFIKVFTKQGIVVKKMIKA